MPSRPTRPSQLASATRRGSTRTTGLVIAAILGVVSISTVAYFLSTSKDRRGGRGTALLPNDGAVPPPELIQPGAASAIKQGAPTLTGGKGIRAELASRSDPTRLAGRILSASLDPLEGSRYHAELPESYLYLKDGRTIYIRSDTAKFLLPQGPSGQPDSGVLEGNVSINVFDRRPDGGEIDIAKDAPSLTLTTSTLTFDMTAGQFTGPDRFTVTGPTVDFAGTGLNILYNQKDERLELLTIAKSETLKLRPKNQRPASKPSAAGSAAAPGNTPVAVTPAPSATTASSPKSSSEKATTAVRPVVETFYRAILNDTVSVRQGARTIESDVMDVWVHLIDNQLAPDAIAQTKTGARPDSTARSATEPVGTSSAPMATGVPTAISQSPPTVMPSSSDEVVMSWTGPLEIRPLAERPATLVGNEVATRFSAKPGSVVAFKDGVSHADGTSSTLDYAATTRDIAMAAQEPRGVHLTLPNAGEVFAQRLSINLNTGVASVPSAGELRSLGKGTGLVLTGDNDPASPPPQDDPLLPNAPELVDSQGVFAQGPRPRSIVRPVNAPMNRTVSWTEQADFLFATSNGTISGSLLSATLSGEVRGTDRYAGLNAGWLKVEFSPAVAHIAGLESTRDSSATVLKRLQARDHASAWDGRGGDVSAERLDVVFEPRPHAPTASDPVLVTLTGSAGASREGSTLTAELIEAKLVGHAIERSGSSDERNRTDSRSDVSDVLARGNVLFARNDGTWAQGDELRANTATQIADLLGERAAIGKDNTRVEGAQMRLDGSARSLEVFGPGVFRFGAPRNILADLVAFGTSGLEFRAGGKARPDAELPTENGTASWTLGMTFDDRSGFVDCRGGVRAEMNRDATSQRSLAGEKLHVELTPGTGSQNSSSSDPTASETRKLLRAAIFGSLDDPSSEARASLQSATYEAGADPSRPRRMIGLQYLEGSTIRADDVLGTLTVPGSGQMLVADRKPAEARASGASTPASEVRPLTRTNDLQPSSRGDSLFTWQGGFVADRNANTATIHGGVRITHQPPASLEITELESEEVVAYVTDSNAAPVRSPGSDSDQLRVRLSRATAKGAVWARSSGKELTADLLDYDAAGRMMRASGSDNNDVILFDPAKPTPITAKLLEWDLARDRVEVKKPGTIVMPADIVKGR